MIKTGNQMADNCLTESPCCGRKVCFVNEKIWTRRSTLTETGLVCGEYKGPGN